MRPAEPAPAPSPLVAEYEARRRNVAAIGLGAALAGAVLTVLGMHWLMFDEGGGSTLALGVLLLAPVCVGLSLGAARRRVAEPSPRMRLLAGAIGLVPVVALVAGAFGYWQSAWRAKERLAEAWSCMLAGADGDFQRAAALAEEASRLDAAGHDPYLLAAAHLGRGDFKAAFAEAERESDAIFAEATILRVAESDGTDLDPDLRFLEGQIAVWRGDFPRARRALEAVLAERHTFGYTEKRIAHRQALARRLLASLPAEAERSDGAPVRGPGR
jgi:hypothetical protein